VLQLFTTHLPSAAIAIESTDLVYEVEPTDCEKSQSRVSANTDRFEEVAGVGAR
jgi:hypothetical protein